MSKRESLAQKPTSGDHPIASRTASIVEFRKRIVAQAFRPTDSLAAAFSLLRFIQADPIRAPARAQDLILRHRVVGYKAGNLELAYPNLPIEEGFFFVYGFHRRNLWQALHPCRKKRLTPLERRVLDMLRESGPSHPRVLTELFGKRRVTNAWGGYSHHTKQALETLHHHGLLRVAGRANGVRIYEAAPAPTEAFGPDERLQMIALGLIAAVGPIREKAVHSELHRFKYIVVASSTRRQIVADLIRHGRLERTSVDGISYLHLPFANASDETDDRVRFLAPFDPLVRDRESFEHLWGWTYRFEAYTPPAKRIRGYYAMPLLWRDEMIGWVNATTTEDRLGVHFGYVDRRPRGKGFIEQAEFETARLAEFLGLGDNWEAEP